MEADEQDWLGKMYFIGDFYSPSQHDNEGTAVCVYKEQLWSYGSRWQTCMWKFINDFSTWNLQWVRNVSARKHHYLLLLLLLLLLPPLPLPLPLFLPLPLHLQPILTSCITRSEATGASFMIFLLTITEGPSSSSSSSYSSSLLLLSTFTTHNSF